MHTKANIQADKLFAERVLARSSGLIAVSENTRQDAVRILRIAPEKIEVIRLRGLDLGGASRTELLELGE